MGPNQGFFVRSKKVQRFSTGVRHAAATRIFATYVDLLERILDRGIRFSPADAVNLRWQPLDQALRLSPPEFPDEPQPAPAGPAGSRDSVA